MSGVQIRLVTTRAGSSGTSPLDTPPSLLEFNHCCLEEQVSFAKGSTSRVIHHTHYIEDMTLPYPSQDDWLQLMEYLLNWDPEDADNLVTKFLLRISG